MDTDGEFSQQELDKIRMSMNDPNVDKSLKKLFQMYEDLMLLPQKTQEESDRRWQILVEAKEKYPAEEKPKTMGAHRDLILKYGFKVGNVPKKLDGKEANYDDFMQSFGNKMQMVEDYEMKGAPDAKPRCDECKKEGRLKCKQCGESYCSREYQKKAWPDHKEMCKIGS